METHEYAYEVNLLAAVRIRATDESSAYALVEKVVRNSLSYYSESDKDLLDMCNAKLAEGLKVLDITIGTQGDSEALLFEVDGKEVP